MIRWKSKKTPPRRVFPVPVLRLPMNFHAINQVWQAIWEATDDDRPFTMLSLDHFFPANVAKVTRRARS